jgi:hypothetical protein
MSRQTFLKRLGAGLALLILLLALAFALTLPMIHRWGATDEEVASALPGDDLLPQPIVNWTNSITIDASPAEVWPWIVQMGDTRGGFYSYTFIENRVGAIFGSADYQVVYRNAGRIIPEWQNPAPGDEIIQGTLKIREAQPGQWLLADSVSADTFGWTWLWRLYPAGNGQQTRLVNRMRIQTPAELNNPVLTFVMDIGGFVMEQNMMQGIKTRAEGGREPAAIEAVEIIIWLAALLTGLVAAGFYLFQPAWQRPLVVAVASVLVLMVLTFVQPAIWLRLVLDALLWLALWWAYRPAQEETAINVAFA